ncbi:MAG: PcfJ domain-containing protein [Eubacteriales bacterium]|nr:PcfJ domain-containing protein [Eubacteriales bacterium]
MKANLYQLSYEIVKYGYYLKHGPNSSSLTKALEINKGQLRRLRNMNGGIHSLNWLQYETKSGKQIANDVIAWYVQRNLPPEKLAFVLNRMSPVQIKNYLLRQSEENESTISDTLVTWRDYLSMAKICCHDVTDEIIYRTSKLFQRHQELIDKLKQRERKKRVDEVSALYPGIQQILLRIKNKYTYQDDDYAMLVPESIEDIVREGDSLHHCVATMNIYFKQIHDREAYILFLRKRQAVKLPYYTIEAEPDGTVRQKHSEYDRVNSDIKQIEKFLSKWQKEVCKRIGEEEQKLAEVSRQAWQQQVEILRNNHAVIQGGIYDGRLMADVLEEDIIENQEAA